MGALLPLVLLLTSCASPLSAPPRPSPVPRALSADGPSPATQPSSSTPPGAGDGLSYALNITEPLTEAGTGGFYPVINQDLFDNVTYDPATDGFYAQVSGAPYLEHCWEPSSVPFAPPPPGQYYFGVEASSGAWYANWSARSIEVVDSNGTTTELSSWPSAPYHPSLTLGGLGGPAYNATTGALRLLEVPRLQSDGFALFPFTYGGGSISIDLQANFSYSFGGPVDGLTTLFFLSEGLVNTSVSHDLNVTAPANGSVAFVNREGLFDAMTAFPLSTRPYLAIRWEPGVLWFFGTLGETQEYVVEPDGTFLQGVGAPSAPTVVYHELNLSAQVSSPQAGLQYAYVGLPAGCTTQDLPEISCTPIALGHFDVRVFVNDSGGDSATAWTTVDVVPAPVAPSAPSCSGWTCELIEPGYLALSGGAGLLAAAVVVVLAYRRRSRPSEETHSEPETSSGRKDTPPSPRGSAERSSSTPEGSQEVRSLPPTSGSGAEEDGSAPT